MDVAAIAAFAGAALLWADALGLALYAVAGAEITLLAGADPCGFGAARRRHRVFRRHHPRRGLQ